VNVAVGCVAARDCKDRCADDGWRVRLIQPTNYTFLIRADLCAARGGSKVATMGTLDVYALRNDVSHRCHAVAIIGHCENTQGRSMAMV